jgi:hypothetical protein
LTNKELVAAWKFTQAVKEEPQNNDSIPIGSLLDIGLEQGTQSKPLEVDLEEIKIIAEDLVTQARKAGHTIIPKLQPETD